MGVLMITCPHTGRGFSTGIQLGEEAFNSLPDVLVHSRCPYCGLQHSWWKREARFVGSASPAQRVEAQRTPLTSPDTWSLASSSRRDLT
jgi:hypothetical protein